jgi:hypothetical protein
VSTATLGTALRRSRTSLLEAVNAAVVAVGQLGYSRNSRSTAFAETQMASNVVAVLPNNALERTRVRWSRRAFPPLAAQLGR